MQFVYSGPISGPVEIPALHITVEPGEEFEATGEDAKALLAQPSNYERVDRPVERQASTDEKEQ